MGRYGQRLQSGKFLLTRPSRGATGLSAAATYSDEFLLTRPSRGATRTAVLIPVYLVISTHTPLAGRDIPLINFRTPGRTFLLTRPSRGAVYPGFLAGFLLTRPSRGATASGKLLKYVHIDFYSHAPRGARLPAVPFIIPAPRISTHTPLAGRDILRNHKIVKFENFYSHAPRGARRKLRDEDCIMMSFLLTRPSRGATLPLF